MYLLQLGGPSSQGGISDETIADARRKIWIKSRPKGERSGRGSSLISLTRRIAARNTLGEPFYVKLWGFLTPCRAKNYGQNIKQIYLIDQARGPIFSQDGPEQVWLIRDLLHDWRKQRLAKTQARDHSGQCPVRYLENIGPAIEHFDWFTLVIGPLTAWVV